MTFELFIVANNDETSSFQGFLGESGSNLYPIAGESIQSILEQAESNSQPIVGVSIQDVLERVNPESGTSIQNILERIGNNFWEPVKITTSLSTLPYGCYAKDSYECPVCSEYRCKVYKLPCCKQRMCKFCGTDWFENQSVNCPFCRKDLRDYLGT